MKTNRGVTVLELLIAAAIIGLLAALAIPRFIAMDNIAKDQQLIRNMKQVQLAVESYAIQHYGEYPTASYEDASQVQLMMKDKVWPENPFEPHTFSVRWGELPQHPGEIGYLVTGPNHYRVIGYGSTGHLNLEFAH